MSAFALRMPRLKLRKRLQRLREGAERSVAALRTAFGVTDYRRWRRVGREEPEWDGRNDLIGRLVTPGSRVLDVGCGRQTLRRVLPATCVYQPCDIVQHDPGVWVWNFNTAPFPRPEARFDTVVSSGVMEYAEDPAGYLGVLADLGEELILSYASLEGVPSRFDRRAAGWVNDLTEAELSTLFVRLGLVHQRLGAWKGQGIYRVSRRALREIPADLLRVGSGGATLCGSFGFGNAGDEGAWMAARDLAAHLGMDLRFDLLTRFDAPTDPGVVGMGPRDAARRRRLVDHPVVFLGGGVVEQSEFGVLTAAERFLAEVAVPAFGLLGINAESGVEYAPALARRIRERLESARYVSARDDRSAEVLRALAPGVRVEVTGDIVLWLRPDPSGLPGAVAELPRYVAVNLAPRWSDAPGWHDWIAGELVRVARTLDAPLVFVPCSSDADDDRPEHALVARKLADLDAGVRTVQVVEPLGVRQTAALFGRAEVTLAMRLHACVMSYAGRAPCVALGYHPKVYGFMETVGARAFIVPAQAPDTQHAKRYGYAFSAGTFAGADLAALAEKALATFPFDALDRLKQRTADGFKRCLSPVL